MLSKGEITPPWGVNALGPSGRQDQLQQVQHVPVLDPPRQLRQEDVVPNVVEVRPQVEIDDTRLAFPDRLAHPVHRFMCRPPRPVLVRPRLEVGLEGFRRNQRRTEPAAFALSLRARPPGLLLSRPRVRLLPLRPGNSLAAPNAALSMGFSSLSVSLLAAIQATGLLILSPVGLSPTERASLLVVQADEARPNFGASQPIPSVWTDKQ